MVADAEGWHQTLPWYGRAALFMLVIASLASALFAGAAAASYHQDDDVDVGIEIASTNSPVVEGDTLEIVVRYTNEAEEPLTDSVELTVAGEVRDAADVEVEADSNTDVELAWDTTEGDADSYDAVVTTEHAGELRNNVEVEAGEDSTTNSTSFAGTIRLVPCSPDCTGDPVFLASTGEPETASATVGFDEMIRTEALAPPEQDDEARELEAVKDYDPPELDASAVSYDWYVDGERVGAGDSAKIDFDEPGRYEVTMVALDGDGGQVGRSSGIVELEDGESDGGSSTAAEGSGGRQAPNVEINVTVRGHEASFRPDDVFTVHEYRLNGEPVARTASEKPQYGIVRATGESNDDSESASSYYYYRRRGEPRSEGGSGDGGGYVEIPAKKVVKFKPGAELSLLVYKENEDGESVAGWQSVTIPGKSVEQDSYREGNEAKHEKKLWGQVSFDDLEMERGVKPGDTKLHDWFENVRPDIGSSIQEIQQTLEDCDADVCREVAASADQRERYVEAAASAAEDGNRTELHDWIKDIQAAVETDVERLEDAQDRELGDEDRESVERALELERELLQEVEAAQASLAEVESSDSTGNEVEAAYIGPTDDPEEDCPVICAVEGQETAELHVDGTHLATALREDVRAGKADAARKEIAVVRVTGSSGSRMNKAELIDSIASEADITKADGGKALDAFIDTTTKALLAGGDGDQERGITVNVLEVTNEEQAAGTVVTGQIEQGVREGGKTVGAGQVTEILELSGGGGVSLVGFESFSVKKKSARKGRNPQTGKEIKIPASDDSESDDGRTLLSFYGDQTGATALESALDYAAETKYTWRVDGEVVSEEPTFDHTFESTAEHQVELTVTEPDGSSYSARENVTVSQAEDGDDGDGGGEGEEMPGFGVLAAVAALAVVAAVRRLDG